MRPADTWKDYELLDATDGNRLERWGAAASGSTSAVCPKKWKISCGEGEDKLTLIVSPTGFKHTGVFPEQAVNWAWYAKRSVPQAAR